MTVSITGFDTIHYEAGEAVAANSNEIWTLTTTAAVTKGQFVQVAANATCAPATGTITGPVGIALKTAASGSTCRVLIAEYGTVTADATGVTIGQYVKSDANGKATAATLGTDDIIGICANNSGANGVAVVKIMPVSKN